jgi:hypothetical protein
MGQFISEIFSDYQASSQFHAIRMVVFSQPKWPIWASKSLASKSAKRFLTQARIAA